LRGALDRLGVPRAEVERVLGRLRDLRYIDDEKFAADWSERLQERGFGSLRIRQQLERDGIHEESAERVIPAVGQERRIARRVLRARFGVERPAETAARSRAWRFLLSRGFPPEVVESVLSLWEE
jgi:regulatory protein